MTSWADVLADVRIRLNEPDATMWSDDELKWWANEACRDVARRLKCLRDVRSFDAINGQGEYEMPEDMIQAYEMEYRQSSTYITTMEYVPRLSMDEVWGLNRTNTGTPMYWSTDGFPGGQGRIVVYPAASSDISDGFRLYYYRLPRRIEDTEDEVEVPAGWEDLVSLYVESNARRKEATDSKWRDAQQLYEMRLKECEKVTRNYSDQPQYMTAGRGSLPWWVAGEW